MKETQEVQKAQLKVIIDSYIDNYGVGVIKEIKSDLAVKKVKAVKAKRQDSKKIKDAANEKCKLDEMVRVAVRKVSYVNMGKTGFGSDRDTLAEQKVDRSRLKSTPRRDNQAIISRIVQALLKKEKVSLQCEAPKTRSLLIINYDEITTTDVVRKRIGYLDVPNVEVKGKVLPGTPDFFEQESLPLMQ